MCLLRSTNVIDSSTKGQRFSKNKIDRSLLKHFIIIQTKFKKKCCQSLVD